MEIIKNVKYLTAKESAKILEVLPRQFKRLLKTSDCPLVKSRIPNPNKGNRKAYLYPEKVVLEYKELRDGIHKRSKRSLEKENDWLRAKNTELQEQINVLLWILGSKFSKSARTKYSAEWFESKDPDKYKHVEEILSGLSLNLDELRERFH